MKEKKIDYEALIRDTLIYRCENTSEALEEIVLFFGEDKIYAKEFAEGLIERFDIDEEDIKEFYSED